jgi:DNA-binding response OmpR family regulator
MDDRVMLMVVREMLDHPDEYTPKPEVFRELLLRLHELLERETAKRPNHRPREDDTGELVANLYEVTGDLARSKRRAAKVKKKTVRTVARAYERHLQNEKRQK